MDLTVVVVGLAVLVGIAVVIGLIQGTDGGARDRAWREIALARRHNWEERQRLLALREELDRCGECPFSPPRSAGDANH